MLLAIVPSGASEPSAAQPSFVLARADPRLCPSPMCGGIWVSRVNRDTTVCGDGTRREECYAASADLSLLRAGEKRQVHLQRLITEGRAVVRGTLVLGQVEGFPELDTLFASEVWTASSSLGRARGGFRKLRDSGTRCVTTPCFSTNAAVLNTRRVEKVSSVDLSRTGAPPAERKRALGNIAGPGLVAAGRIVRQPNGGRAFLATQFYVRAY
jgi:hypothetical protein